ncbi:6-phosphogluconate dehydrogenase, decarboxylating [Amylibacter marinus]|uniref:6-phosphogluconate dehydrogenase, decarboxylating n=1 Tax=Amylibacter marinus TaxID=1475483 RepID=A0ABQ5VVE2_9RHOB|nr:NADP-dependent phosphogluconate dehydrogenase [Amylibacter marinus]GLQ35227.1 6-phosphogluconate dehydrogenase, decarboxylating [Amylibacter marinus]
MTHLGLIGVGVMGASFAQNLAENGHAVSLLDRDISKAQAVADAGADLAGDLIVCEDAQALINSLPQPRSILVLVPAGGPLDTVIDMLIPLLSQGDLIADLGNSNYLKTQERVARVEAAGLQFLGMGISGGAKGARIGPSIMAGGSKDSWARVQGPLRDASAKFEGEACCNWFGPGGSGHFIKMIHNGIEYADMQQIAETYGIMRDGLGMDATEIAAVFKSWMKGPLNSYLIEIAAEVAAAIDPKTSQPILDLILDKAGQKGTGRWSVIEALHLGAPASLMMAAVEARNISANKEGRTEMQAAFGASPVAMGAALGSRQEAIDILENAMIAAKVCAYVQGFEVLKRASDAFSWDLDLAAIARVWRAGCIIRSVFLDEISGVFDAGGHSNLALAPIFRDRLMATTPDLQRLVGAGVMHGQQVPALFAALGYHNMRRTGNSTANMIQGLRDYFGAHTFERIDDLGQAVNGPWHNTSK